MAEIEPFLGKKFGKIWIPQKTPFLENRSQRPNPLTQNRTLWGFYMFKGWGQVGGSGRSGSQNHRFMITKFLTVGPLKRDKTFLPKMQFRAIKLLSSLSGTHSNFQIHFLFRIFMTKSRLH